MSHCEIPAEGPSGLSIDLAHPLEGPSAVSVAANSPENGPSNLSAITGLPLNGPAGLTLVNGPPTSGPSSLDVVAQPPAAGPAFIFADQLPAAGPSSTVASINPPVSGPGIIFANNTVLSFDPPIAGPSNVQINTLGSPPVAGPSSLVADQRAYILTDEEFIEPGVNVPTGYTVFRTGTVDNKKPGTYTLTYTLRDPATGITAILERKVVVIQRPPPIIEIAGGYNYYALKGSGEFVPPVGTNPDGFTVFVVDNVDTLRNGSYQIIYYVQDEYKNTGMETVTVHVVDQIPEPGEGPGAGPGGTGVTVGGPATLTVTGGDQTVELGETWIDPGVTTNEPGVTITVTYEKED